MVSCVNSLGVESVPTPAVTCSSSPMVESWVSTSAIPMLFALSGNYDSISKVALTAASSDPQSVRETVQVPSVV